MAPAPSMTPGWTAEDNGGATVRTAIAFDVVLTAFLALFIVSRHLKKTLYQIDVVFILLSYFCTIALTITGFISVIKAGAGKHFSVVAQDWSKVALWLKVLVVVQFSYIYAVTFPKLAILCLYLRVFNKRIYRQIAYATIVVLIANAIALSVLAFRICVPFAYQWDKFIPGGRCGNQFLAFKLASVPNIATDVVILLLPIPVIWKLQVKTKQKIGLMITFLTGSFGTVTAIIRFYQFFAIDFASDLTYNASALGAWTIIEPGIYTIAAIMPSLRPLLKAASESRAYTTMRSHFSTFTTRKGTQASSAITSWTDRRPSVMSDKASSQQEFLPGSMISVTREFIVEFPKSHQ